MAPFTSDLETVTVAVFDATLDGAPVQEGNLDPILPEERFTLELIGFERSDPDQYRKNGGIKWTFAVFNADGSPFMFQDEPYELWRTTNINASGQPIFNIGTQAHDWASALLGRTLGVDEKFSVSELRNKRMSAMVVWRNKKPPAQGKTFDLASLRHVPVSSANGRAARPDPTQVSSNPTNEEIDRAAIVADLQKAVKSLTKLDAEAGKQARDALAASDLADAPLDDLHRLLSEVQAAVAKALDD